jgi:ubiquinone/menaquinone biosynthesis methyltransferase
MFDRIAPTYDTVNRVLSVGIDGEWRKRALRTLRPHNPGRVLDLCAGTLDVAAAVERAFPRAQIVAADLSAEMLERGKHKAPRTERVTCDATDLPFGAEAFDAVVCSFGIRNVANTAACLREVRRVLGPNGIFVTLEFFRPERVITRAFHSVYGRWVMPTVGGLLSKDRSAYAYLVGSMGAFLSVREYEDQLRAAGFAKVRHESLTLGVATLVVAEVAP